MRKVQECFADGTASHLLAIAGAACAGGMKEKKNKKTTGEFYLCCEVAAVTCQCDISRSLFLPLSVYLVPRGLNSG